MSIQIILIGLKTIVKREIIRIIRIWPQTIVPSIITTSLYFIIFGDILFQNRFIIMNNKSVPYNIFLVPGLIAMSIILNAYNNTSSSFFSIKFQKNIEELLVSPLPIWVIILGYTIGGIVRALTNGFLVLIISFYFISFSVHSYFFLLFISLLTSLLFSMLGIINAIFSQTFDDLVWVPSFILTPMVYFGGIFFTIEMLSPFWQTVVKLNPTYYILNLFRFSIINSERFNLLSVIGIFILNIILFIFAVFCFNKKLQK